MQAEEKGLKQKIIEMLRKFKGKNKWFFRVNKRKTKLIKSKIDVDM